MMPIRRSLVLDPAAEPVIVRAVVSSTMPGPSLLEESVDNLVSQPKLDIAEAVAHIGKIKKILGRMAVQLGVDLGSGYGGHVLSVVGQAHDGSLIVQDSWSDEKYLAKPGQ